MIFYLHTWSKPGFTDVRKSLVEGQTVLHNTMSGGKWSISFNWTTRLNTVECDISIPLKEKNDIRNNYSDRPMEALKGMMTTVWHKIAGKPQKMTCCFYHVMIVLDFPCMIDGRCIMASCINVEIVPIFPDGENFANLKTKFVFCSVWFDANMIYE